MKVLVITQHIPYQPCSGTHLRILNLLACLSREWETDCLFLVDDSDDVEARLGQCRLPVNNHFLKNPRRYAAGRYLQHLAELVFVSRERRQGISRLVSELNPDVIWLECGYLGNLIPMLRRFNKPVVYGTHNSQYQLDLDIWKANPNLIYRLKMAPFIALYKLHEQLFTRLADLVVCISNNDKQYYHRYLAADRVQYLPFIYEDGAIEEVQPFAAPHPYICIVGSLRAYQNYEAVMFALDRIWPGLVARLPELHLYIVGALPLQESPEYSRLQASAAALHNVVLTGQVPSVIPYVKGAVANLAPLLIGSGVRTKIIESAACKTPVVSTTIGADGLPFDAGRSIILADSAELLQKGIFELANDPQRRQEIASLAYRTYREEFSREAGVRRLRSIFSALPQPLPDDAHAGCRAES